MKRIFIYIFAVILLSQFANAELRLMIRLKSNVKLELINASKLQSALKEEQSYFYYLNKQSLANVKESQLKMQEILKAEEPLLRTYFVNVESDLPFNKYARLLYEKYPEIELIEEQKEVKVQGQFIPNDPLYKMQEHLTTIKAFDAWDIYQGSENVVIAISDAGFDISHNDLKSNVAINLAENLNGIDDDGNGYIDDYDGYDFQSNGDNRNETYNSIGSHGMNVAGISSATFNNQNGIAGVGGRSKFFPLKITDDGKEAIYYGMQSIIYAAVRGFKVINCSWGQKDHKFSQIEQSIIDYAVARDLLVVCSAGNSDATGYNAERLQPFFPAGYNGVLAVGSSDLNDVILNDCALGMQTRILAPGVGYMTLGRDDSYSNISFGGTSFASPCVAGAAALVRGKYPELSAMETLEFIRQCTDDVEGKNPTWGKITPRRLNMLTAMTIDPFEIPGIRNEKTLFKDKNGKVQDKFNVSDEVRPVLKLKNYLGSASKLKFTLSNVWDMQNAVNLKSTVIENVSIQNGESIELEGFSFDIVQQSNEFVMFRVDITNEDGYSDFFFFKFTPYNYILTLENDKIKVSVSDEGTLGYSTNIQNIEGQGFELKGIGGKLYNGGLIVYDGKDSYVGAVDPNFEIGYSDFKVLERMTLENPKTKLYGLSDNNFGLPFIVEQEFKISNKYPFIRIDVKVTNDGEDTYEGLGVGYKMDWDVGKGDRDYDFNKSAFFGDAIPETIKDKASAQIVTSTKYPFAFASAANSGLVNTSPVAAAYINGTWGLSSITAAFNGGTTKNQTTKTGDISYLTGVKLNEPFLPQQSYQCYFCLAGGENKEEVQDAIFRCLAFPVSVENFENSDDIITIYPNPSSSYVRIKISDDTYNSYKLKNLIGDTLLEGTVDSEELYLDLANISSNLYFIELISSKRTLVKKIAVNK